MIIIICNFDIFCAGHNNKSKTGHIRCTPYYPTTFSNDISLIVHFCFATIIFIQRHSTTPITYFLPDRTVPIWIKTHPSLYFVTSLGGSAEVRRGWRRLRCFCFWWRWWRWWSFLLATTRTPITKYGIIIFGILTPASPSRFGWFECNAIVFCFKVINQEGRERERRLSDGGDDWDLWAQYM